MYYLIFFLLLAAFLQAFPPPVPSAGVVERELEKEYEAKPLEIDKETPAIQIDIPRARLKFSSRQKILIHTIKIRGNEALQEEEICEYVQGCLDKELSLQDIYEVCHKIDIFYAKKGYFLARAYPPPQDIKKGELVIEILEGKLGNITVVGNHYYSEAFIRGYFVSLQNRPLRYEEFLRSLMLLNENTDLMAGAVFEKGEEFGCADVIVRVNDASPRHLYLNGNNYGRNLTTNVRAGGRFDWGNCITQGDTLSVAEVVGFPVNALYFTDVTYTAPLNKNGTSIEVAYLFSAFKIEELTSLHLKGRSDIGTLKATQAWIRNRLMELLSRMDLALFSQVL